jgi:hypothetical protein
LMNTWRSKLGVRKLNGSLAPSASLHVLRKVLSCEKHKAWKVLSCESRRLGLNLWEQKSQRYPKKSPCVRKAEGMDGPICESRSLGLQLCEINSRRSPKKSLFVRKSEGMESSIALKPKARA